MSEVTDHHFHLKYLRPICLHCNILLIIYNHTSLFLAF